MKEIAVICVNLDQVRITVDSLNGLLYNISVKRTLRVSHCYHTLLFLLSIRRTPLTLGPSLKN